MAKKTKRASTSSTAKSKRKSPSSSAKAEGQFLAKLWGDDEFRAAFVADPISVLQQSGFSVPEGLHIKVVQDTPDTYHIVIPNRPENVSVRSVSVEKTSALILTRRPEFSGSGILTRRPQSQAGSILTRRPSGTTKRRRGK